METTSSGPRLCPCGKGVDDDGDGDCAICAAGRKPAININARPEEETDGPDLHGVTVDDVRKAKYVLLRRAGDDGRLRDVIHFAVTTRAPDLGGVVLYCTHGGWYGELTITPDGATLHVHAPEGADPCAVCGVTITEQSRLLISEFQPPASLKEVPK